MSAVVVRPAAPRDSVSVRALASRTPMSAARPLVVERSAISAHPMLEGETIDLVATRGNAIVGYVHGRVEPRWLRRGAAWEKARLLYFGDLRVDARARNAGVARSLLDHLAAHALARKATAGFCLVNEGNDAMLRLLASGRCKLRGAPARTFTTASRIVVRPRPEGALDLRQTRPTVDEVMELALRTRASLAPASADPARVAQLLDEEAIFLRGEDGALAFAVWDQRRFRRLSFAPPPFGYGVLRAGWNVLAPRFGGHSLPSRGWRQAETTLLAADATRYAWEPAAALAARDLGCQLLNVIEEGLAANGDASGAMPVRGPALRMKTHVVVYGIDGAAPPHLPHGQAVHVDLAFV